MEKKYYSKLEIKGKQPEIPIIQGGMGVGVSLARLAGAVANEGGIGIISSACIDYLVSKRLNRKIDTYQAMRIEIENAKKLSPKGLIGVNIMVAIQKEYNATVRASIDAGADFIISGAGMPLNLPGIKKPGDTAEIPIVSSSRALKLICEKWERLGYRPDAVVLEGPLAGGHLGFKFEEIDNPNFTLENLFPKVKEVAMLHGDIPVIVAGGIFSKEDILKFMKLGADGVQSGTRFLGTHESDANMDYKQALIEAEIGDIQIAINPRSPCGLPFRVIKKSPILRGISNNCDKSYLLQKDADGIFSKCPAKTNKKDFFCICNGLIGNILFTTGAKGYLVKKISSVKEVMDEFKEPFEKQQKPA